MGRRSDLVFLDFRVQDIWFGPSGRSLGGFGASPGLKQEPLIVFEGILGGYRMWGTRAGDERSKKI